ncbi:unnamed protein product [Rangifer tarandus platyrhynchus]|uniref:Uncharacterized protein n=1 Tax=Rangifer tarandus platyrhynchus TaxID=3082113 RepID=A0ABN8ZLY1_RANTA|nr:unnamed protein product [Rangifer tarandus platyrhynchus]
MAGDILHPLALRKLTQGPSIANQNCQLWKRRQQWLRPMGSFGDRRGAASPDPGLGLFSTHCPRRPLYTPVPRNQDTSRASSQTLRSGVQTTPCSEATRVSEEVTGGRKAEAWRLAPADTLPKLKKAVKNEPRGKENTMSLSLERLDQDSLRTEL